MTGDQDGNYFYAIIAILLSAAVIAVGIFNYPLAYVALKLHKAKWWAIRKQLEADKDAAKAREDMDK